MEIPSFVDRIARERNCTPELVRAITGDCLAALHKSAIKGGMGTALEGAFWELGELSAWHFGGMIVSAAEHDPGELAEHYRYLAPDMKRFYHIIELWKEELEQERASEE